VPESNGDHVADRGAVADLAPTGADPIGLPGWLTVSAVGALLTGVATRSLLSDPGLPDGHDVGPHLVNTVEYARCFADGIVWPLWLPDLAAGYGGPNPVFYAPLAFQLSGRLHQTGLGAAAALKGGALVAMVLSFAGAFAWGRRVWRWPGGLLVASLYLLAPYHLFDLYGRFAYPELVGMGLAPWAFHFARRALEGASPWAWKATAAVLAAMIAVHNLSVVLFGGLLAGYVLAHVVLRGGCRAVASLVPAIPLALGLSAFAWLPLACSVDEVHLRQDASMRSFWAAQLLSPHRLLEEHWPGDRLHLPLYPGRLHVALVALALLTAIPAVCIAPRPGVAYLAFAAVVLAHLGLTLEGSRPIWERTWLPLIQFPWRFLSAVALGGSFLVPLAVWPLARWPRLYAAACTVLALTAGVHYRNHAWNHPWKGPIPTAGSLRHEFETGDFEQKYLPLGAHQPSTRGHATIEVAAGDGRVTTLASTAELHRALVEARTPLVLDIRIYEFPGWTAELDGRPLALEREEGIGGMRVRTGTGTHELVVRFGRTPPRAWSAALSLACLVLLLVPDGRRGACERADAPPRRAARLRRAVRAAAGSAAAAAAIARALVAADRWFPLTHDHHARLARTALLGHRVAEALDHLAKIRPDSPHGARARALAAAYRDGGVTSRYFRDDRWSAPGVERREYLLRFDTDVDPGSMPPTGLLSALHTARLRVDRAGRHGFALESDDGSWLYVDARRIVDCGGPHPLRRSEGAADLAAGSHELAVAYFNMQRGGVLRVWWQPPGEPWTSIPVDRLTPARFDWADRLPDQLR
jgi:hypothetical protein